MGKEGGEGRKLPFGVVLFGLQGCRAAESSLGGSPLPKLRVCSAEGRQHVGCANDLQRVTSLTVRAEKTTLRWICHFPFRVSAPAAWHVASRSRVPSTRMPARRPRTEACNGETGAQTTGEGDGFAHVYSTVYGAQVRGLGSDKCAVVYSAVPPDSYSQHCQKREPCSLSKVLVGPLPSVTADLEGRCRGEHRMLRWPSNTRKTTCDSAYSGETRPR